MLTFEQAKEIGMNACIERLGRDFVEQYRDSSCPGYGNMEDRVYCSLGVDNSEDRNDYENVPLILTSNNPFPYRVSCTVRYEDGKIEFIEYATPDHEEMHLPEFMKDLV